ncbi:hypothetical protein ACFV8E_17435 [Streptomyces sp. NPDC059849]|uniref:hypothetical protein n=1 Tax=Streptomyces sp. NPDC059849 TaxID=3346969 RepID=UPI00365D4BF4
MHIKRNQYERCDQDGDEREQVRDAVLGHDFLPGQVAWDEQGSAKEQDAPRPRQLRWITSMRPALTITPFDLLCRAIKWHSY